MQLRNNHFFLNQSQDIDAILQPLKRFGVVYYTYIANHRDGSQVYLSNSSRWIEDYYTLNLYRSSIFEFNPELYQDSHVLWDSNSSSDVISHGKQYFDSDNGITIIKPKKEFCEFHIFSASVNNSMITNFYINNLDILNVFIMHMKEQAQSIFKRAEKNRLIIPDHYTKNCYDINDVNLPNLVQRDEFFRDIKTTDQRSLFSTSAEAGHLQNIKLTRREQECLKYLVQGKSAKQTANLLNLSPRTVEIYLDTLKSKLNCRTKLALVGKVCGGMLFQ